MQNVRKVGDVHVQISPGVSQEFPRRTFAVVTQAASQGAPQVNFGDALP